MRFVPCTFKYSTRHLLESINYLHLPISRILFSALLSSISCSISLSCVHISEATSETHLSFKRPSSERTLHSGKNTSICLRKILKACFDVILYPENLDSHPYSVSYF